MIATALTDMFGLDHPIVLGPMGGVAGGRLAAAVSNAGGLGICQVNRSMSNVAFGDGNFVVGTARVDDLGGIGPCTRLIHNTIMIAEAGLDGNTSKIVGNAGGEGIWLLRA